MNVEPLLVIDKLTAKLSNTYKDLAMTEAALDQALARVMSLEAQLNNPESEEDEA